MRTFLLIAVAIFSSLISRSGPAAEEPSTAQVLPVPNPDFVFRSQSPEPSDIPEAWSIDGQTPYIQQFGGGYRYGDGLGFQNGFADLEWMIPIRGDAEFDNFFIDTHFLLKDQNKVAGNVTLNYRRYNLEWNRIFGTYIFWDGMQTPLGNQLQQLGVGFETMGQIIDARTNVYIPDAFGVRGALPNLFQGHHLIVNRAEVAMTGVDGEIGINLPEILNVRSRVFGGGYYFNGHGNGNITGWKARAEAEFARNVWIDYSVQDDKLFGRTWNVGLVVRYAHRFLEHRPQSPASMDHKYFRGEGYNSNRVLSDRLSDPVRRNQNLLLTRDDGVAATTPTGTVINFLHVANGFGGTGTFENPFGTLTEALADPGAGTSTIYTPFGGNYVENVTLVPGAKVLSNGPVQTVTTQFGVQTLPFSGAHTDLVSLPTITGNVTMASNSQFSGFDVTGGLSSAATGFTVDNSVITAPAGDAISITGADAATLTNLKVSSATERGVFLNDSSATVRDLHVVNAATNGLEVNTLATARTVTINNLTIDAAGEKGVDLKVTGAGALTYTQTGTTDIQSTGNAFDAALQAGAGNMNLTLGTMTLASTTGTGVNLNGTPGTGRMNVVSLAGGTITKAAKGGIIANKVHFDRNLLTPAADVVSTTGWTIGSSTDTTQVKGNGVQLTNTTGTWSISTLNVFNDDGPDPDVGTGLLVSGGADFTLNTLGGSIKTTRGPAIDLTSAVAANPMAVGLNFGTVESTNSPSNGIKLNQVNGALSIGTTTVNGSTGKSIVIQNTPAALNTKFGNTSIHSTIGPTQNDNVDTATGNGTNLTISFTTLNIVFP